MIIASGRAKQASSHVSLTEKMPNLHVFTLEKELKKFSPADAVILLTMPPRGQKAWTLTPPLLGDHRQVPDSLCASVFLCG